MIDFNQAEIEFILHVLNQMIPDNLNSIVNQIKLSFEFEPIHNKDLIEEVLKEKLDNLNEREILCLYARSVKFFAFRECKEKPNIIFKNDVELMKIVGLL